MGNHQDGSHKPSQHHRRNRIIFHSGQNILSACSRLKIKSGYLKSLVFYLENKVNHTSLKCMGKKENISLPFLLSRSLIAELQELAEGGSDFQCFTFFSAFPFSIPSGLALKMGQFHLPHYQKCQYLGWKGLQGTFKPQPDILHPNTHTEDSLGSTSSTLQHLLKFPSLAVATMFSPHPAQCNYPAQTTVLGFPHSSLPQCFTLPTVPPNPTGMLG